MRLPRSVAVLVLTASACSAAERTDLQSLLSDAEWAITKEVREAFLRNAERTVLDGLQKPLPKSFLSWVRNDPDAYEAVYGTISPPDKRILLNLHALHADLGEALSKKYKQLVLAAAVARRRNGVGPLMSMHKMASMVEAGVRADGEYTGKKSRRKPPPSPELAARRKEAVAVVVAYLKAKNVSALQAFESEIHRAAIGRLVHAKLGKKARPEEILMRSLIVSGQRPDQRDPFPTVSEFFRHLTSIYETPTKELKLPKGSKWPLFPIDRTPWPLLMPLSKTWPLTEARYIWEKYQGRHGGKAYHCYGPYRSRDIVTLAKLRPDGWHWNAWPAVIKQGGVCGTMTTIATGTHTSLGKPSLKAGQPGHSCIVTYARNKNGYFTASVGQSVSSPYNTKTAWPFSDAKTWRAGNVTARMEYHFGLALAMNIGLRKYMDTRIAVHLYRQIRQAERDTSGRKILLRAVERNPYNVEAWYLLAARDVTPAKAMELVGLLRRKVASSKEHVHPWEERAADRELEHGEKEVVLPPAKALTQYANLVAHVILEQTLGDPAGREPADARNILTFLTAERERFGLQGLDSMILKYKIALDGIEKYRAQVKGELLTTLKRKRQSRRQNKKVVARIHTVTAMLHSPQQRIDWLDELRTAFPADKIVQTNKKGERVPDPRYKEIHKALIKELRRNKQRKRAAELNTALNGLLHPEHKNGDRGRPSSDAPRK